MGTIIIEEVAAVTDEQLRLVRAHERGARADRDPEHVHQLRVTVRRLRALLRSDRALDKELRWFGRSLGAVRDLDVLLARLRERLSTFPAEDGAEAEPMLKALRTERRKARKRMVAVFDSTRYQALLAALETARPKSVVDGSAASAYRSLRASADGVGEHSPDDDLHALRVKGKRLRYAAEPVEGLGAVVKAAKDLQTLLGEHQDATVAESTVRRLLDPKTAFVAGRLVQAEHETKLRCRAQLAQALRAVEEAASAKLSH